MKIIAGRKALMRATSPCVAVPELFTGPELAGEESDEQRSAREEAAVDMCLGCRAMVACLEEALTWSKEQQENLGIRGGMTAAQRRSAIRRQRHAATADLTAMRRELTFAIAAGGAA